MYKVGDEITISARVVEVDSEYGEYRVTFKNKSAGLFTEEFIAENADKTYEQGLADAWELVEKIYDMKCDSIEEIFGVNGGFYEVVRSFTFEDCRDKIEAYEKEKEIKVGDVVRYGIGEDIGKYAIVMRIEGNEFYTMYADGSCGRETHTEDFKKTGKHIDIESLLRQIGE